MLALAAIGTSIAELVYREHPTLSNASLIISASTMFITFLFWIPKRYLARALNSSTMRGEALCTLSCIQFSAVLWIGSLIYRLWRNGWWLDSATAIAIALLFGWEGVKMVRWARHESFDGGCCKHCSNDNDPEKTDTNGIDRIASPNSDIVHSGTCTLTDNCCCSDKDHSNNTTSV